ncbi:hypothetical protein [Streptomyces sp. TE5632]
MTSEVRVPELPAVAVDFGTTRHVLAAYRRHASHLLFIGLGIVVITVVLVVVGAVAGVSWLSKPAPYTAGGGLAVAGLGAGALRIAGRMQRLLSGKPWIVCPAVAPAMGTGPTRLVLRTPDTDELWALTVVAVQQRHPLSWPPDSGVLWWCGDPSWGGVVSQPGGRTLVWTRPTRRRRREGDLHAAVSAGLLERPAPPQVQTSATGPAVTGTADTTPARRRPFFRWGALLGAVLLGLGIAGAVAAEPDPQVDLTVVQEDRSGRCTVVWEDPWSGSERRGPFQCDPHVPKAVEELLLTDGPSCAPRQVRPIRISTTKPIRDRSVTPPAANRSDPGVALSTVPGSTPARNRNIRSVICAMLKTVTSPTENMIPKSTTFPTCISEGTRPASSIMSTWFTPYQLSNLLYR